MKYRTYQPAKLGGNQRTDKFVHTTSRPLSVLPGQTPASGHISTSSLLEQVMSSLAWNG